MQTIARITDALPVVSFAPSVQPLTPADFVELPYTPALLLPASFDASITSDPRYHSACESGFGDYFFAISDDPSNLEYDINTPEGVCYFVFLNLADGLSACCVGYVLGALSALALTDRVLALSGLTFLTHLVTSLTASCRVSSRCTGGDGWPLDV